MTPQRKKKPFSPIKKKYFLKSKKSSFPKGLTHAFGQIMPIIEIMLSDFAEKKETYFYYKKQNFSKSRKSHFLDQKMPNSSLFTLGHNKTRYNA